MLRFITLFSFMMALIASCGPFKGDTKFKESSTPAVEEKSADAAKIDVGSNVEIEESDSNMLAMIFGDGTDIPPKKAGDLFGDTGGDELDFEPKQVSLDVGCVHRNPMFVNRQSHDHTLKYCEVEIDLTEHFTALELSKAELVVDYRFWGYNGLNRQLSPGVYDTPPPSGQCGTQLSQYMSSTNVELKDGVRVDLEKSFDWRYKRSGATVLENLPKEKPHPGSKWLYASVKYDKDTKKLTVSNGANGWGACSSKNDDGCAACVSSVVLTSGPKKD